MGETGEYETSDRPPSGGEKRRRLIRRLIRRALLAALVFHLILLVALMVVKLPSWYRGSDYATSTVDASSGSSSSSSSADAPSVADPPSVIGELPDWKPELADRVEQSVRQAQELTPEEQQDNLEQRVAQLESISSQESVDAIAGQLRSFVDAEQRATEPSRTPVEGEFDFDTAQIHDVTRIRSESGDWEYRQVLLDADGRTLELSLDQDQGRRLYDVMQTVKNSPLATTLYRQVVMPTLDKMLKAQKMAAEASEHGKTPESAAEDEEPTVPDADEPASVPGEPDEVPIKDEPSSDVSSDVSPDVPDNEGD